MFNCELKTCTKIDYKFDYFNNNHTHPYYELVYYYEGNGQVSILDTPYDFKENTYSVTLPEHYHNERGVLGTKLIYISFTLSGFTLEDGLFKDDDGEIGRLISECHKELENKSPMFQLILNNLAEKVVLLIVRRAAKGKREDNDFSYILNYIDMSYNLNISVKQIASNLGYNYDYFRSLFIERMNVSAKDYLLQKKLSHAKRLLTSTPYKLSQVSSLCGFSSPSHLCMVFKKMTGQTPQEFISKNKGDSYTNVAQSYLPEPAPEQDNIEKGDIE